jgi:hypothetical protein
MLVNFCNTCIAIFVIDFNLKPTCQLDVLSNWKYMTIAFKIKMEMFMQNLHIYWLSVKVEAKNIYPT